MTSTVSKSSKGHSRRGMASSYGDEKNLNDYLSAHGALKTQFGSSNEPHDSGAHVRTYPITRPPPSWTVFDICPIRPLLPPPYTKSIFRLTCKCKFSTAELSISKAVALVNHNKALRNCHGQRPMRCDGRRNLIGQTKRPSRKIP